MPNLRGASPVGRGEGDRRTRQQRRTTGESAREHEGRSARSRAMRDRCE